jgi:predicted GNAT family N-acyltransferase
VPLTKWFNDNNLTVIFAKVGKFSKKIAYISLIFIKFVELHFITNFFMNIEVHKITNPEQQQAAYKIRYVVFVDEQKVATDEELDEFENTSIHFLAFANKEYAGTCRYRYTEKGIKLERFAVLKAYRGYGLGAALVKATLKDILQDSPQHLENQHKILYLHAQVVAIPFYTKLGFVAEGEIFDECNILHRIMKYKHD